MDNPVINTISLCSGVGMLDEGFAAGLRYMGIDCRCILYAEREAYPCAVLESRMEEGSIYPAPVWCGDFTRLDGRQFRRMVDCIVAGFPCQDLSVAGKRAGLDGKRSGLFFEVVKFADACEARFLFLENVAGIASATATVMDETEEEVEERAAARVMGELADRGWRNGLLFQRPKWVPVMAAPDGSVSHGDRNWMTPKAGTCGMVTTSGLPLERSTALQAQAGCWAPPDCNTSSYSNGMFGPNIREQAKNWPTPNAAPASNDLNLSLSGDKRDKPNKLGWAISQWPTPASRDHKGTNSENHVTAIGGGRKHMDQLPNFVAYSPLVHQNDDGQKSSENIPNGHRHLNPIFASWLMGWPLQWTIAEPHASSASETVLWRCKLDAQLRCLLNDQKF